MTRHLNNYNRADFKLMLGIILVYLLLIKIVFSYIYTEGEASIIWLPSGVGLAILLLHGKRYWPSIFLGILVSYVFVLNRPLLPSISVALLSNTLEPLIAVWLLSAMQYRSRVFDANLNDPSDFLLLTTAAAISALIAALTGCSILSIFNTYAWKDFPSNLLYWWMGNLLGVILVTPLMLIWRKKSSHKPNFEHQKLEVALYIGVSFITGQVLFMDKMHSFFGNVAQNYWMFGLVCWGAVRFGLRITLLVISMVGVQALLGAKLGLGTFGHDYAQSHLTNFWFYMLTLSLVGILLSTFIQKRRQSEIELSMSEMRWKYALEGSGDGVWDWNLQTNEVIFSKSWKAMLGYSEHEIGNHISEWENRVHPEDKIKALADIQAYLNCISVSYTNEHRMLCKDGSWKWFLARGMMFNQIKSINNKPERMVGTHTEISRHKLLENVLKQNEEDLHTIFAQSPDGIVVFDDSRDISHINDAFCQISGLSYDKLIGIKENIFDAMMQNLCGDRSRYPATSNLQHTAITSFSIKQKAQPKRRASDRGEHIEIFIPEHRVLLRSLIQLDQQRLSRVMYFRDITAETLIDRMKSDFLSTAAHELRTPMSIILGYAELLKLRSFDQSTQIKMVDSIHEQSQSIVSLLNELLDLARIEARAGKAFNMQKTSLAPIIKSLTDTFMMAGDLRKVKLSALPELPELLIDKEKIVQALKNCLSNAFKFSSIDSEVSMDVSLTQVTNKPEIIITIRDHGIGMTSLQLARVFEKFYRADTSGKVAGTGLGMSLIKEIIEYHGGEVIVESEFGIGTVVTLTLPVPLNKKEREL